MHVVIDVGPGGDDPVHEAGLHQRNERRVPESRGGERAADGEPHRYVRLQHLVREDVARLPKPGRVVGEEELIHKRIHPDAR